MIQKVIAKASVLIEALPYIQRFRGETVVVKFGGSILNNEDICRKALKDIAFMECVGLRPVLVHGGGTSISKRMHDKGLKAEFIRGLRVTDAESVKIVEQVLNHEVNPHLIEIIRSFDCQAKGVFGNEILRAHKHTETDPKTGKHYDWGYVGDIETVDVSPLNEALDNEIIPVVTPMGSDSKGQIYNVNADATAGAIARQIKARKLVYLSDVPGVLMDPEQPDTLISTLHVKEVEKLIHEGIIAGGMLPKIKGALRAIQTGVRKIHIIDAGMPHSLLLELFTDQGVGTEVML